MQKTSHRPIKSRHAVRVQPRFFLFVGLVLGLISVIVLPVVMGGREVDYTVRSGVLGNPQEVGALIVRDEIVVPAKSFGYYQPVVEEGSDVGEGDHVATVYDSGYSADRDRTELEAVRAEIRALQNSDLLAEVNEQSLAQYSGVIDDALMAWKGLVRGEMNAGILKKENALRKAMDDRQGFLHDAVSMSPENSKLASLYSEEKKLIDRINSLKTDMTAPVAGRVSYFFDGREAILRIENLSQITVQDFLNLYQGKAMSSSINARTDRPLFRIVKPQVYYIVALFPERDPSIAAGATSRMNVGEGGIQVTGTVTHVATDGNQQIVVYRVDGDIGSLLGARVVRVLLGDRQEGLVVPEQALFGRNLDEGTAWVRTQEGVQVGVRVKLIERGEALIEPIESGALRAGMKLSRGGSSGA